LEAQAVFANELGLADVGIARTNDLRELCRVHAHLFGGVYDWAGQVRVVDIKKNVPGARFFLPAVLIARASGFVFGELGEDDNLRGLSRPDFAERLAYFYDQLNYIHPFREGNGRAQRVFWSLVARDAGYWVDWDAVIGDENDRACARALEQGDRSLLVAMPYERAAAPSGKSAAETRMLVSTNTLNRLPYPGAEL
jgi:cell filamentation protein